ncbi:TolC family protein [Niabella ginsengisoli]|uniref:TolC family protein n=1 Tax=Niabella ginsengisoli TaxID=522298 RepID=A0ABS9SHQ1_9BACT|nr:TolC family protein [Niabella ginsengisoli]MCH5597901.1 TolC family protein [Niabella ginsengisoli]
MKTKICVLLMLVFTSLQGFSQESIINDIDDPFLNKCISLAMVSYPKRKATDATLERAKAQISMATMSLFDIFNAGYFYSPQKNEGLIYIPGGGSGGTNNVVLSGFQFGVTVNLGSFLSKPANIKAAKADYKIAKAQSDDYQIELTNLVKSSYYDFLAAKRQLEVKLLAAKDFKSILTNAQSQFQNGTVTLDIYTEAKSASIAADVEALEAEVTYLKAKNTLESIIGTKIENVK